MTAHETPLFMEQGATFPLRFRYCQPNLDADGKQIVDADGQPIPGPPRAIENCYVRMQVRQKKGMPVLIEANSGQEEALGGRRIFLGADADPASIGWIEIELTDEDTQNLTVKKAVYDLEIVWPIVPGRLRPRVDRLLQGPVTVELNVTEDDA